ncbi:MAG: phosphoserine phosphatase SerB [Parvularculaceae bacterium]
MSVTVITLVCNPASPVLSNDEAEKAACLLSRFGGAKRETLNPGVAEDFLVAAKVNRIEVERLLGPHLAGVDIFVQNVEQRRKSMLIADMDSTIIAQECIDELAEYAGKKNEIAEITNRAMRGKLEFESALKERVLILAGLPQSILHDCYRSKISLTPGAKTLVRTMNNIGCTTILVSGGFTFFAERVAQDCGFQHFHANELLLERGTLSGRVAEPILGKDAKETTLLEYANSNSIEPASVLAVGDGANDLAMIKRAGLGVAFHAKPIVADEADANIKHSDLTALLYAQGIPFANFQ